MKQAATVMVMFSSSVRFVTIHQAEYLRFVYLLMYILYFKDFLGLREGINNTWHRGLELFQDVLSRKH